MFLHAPYLRWLLKNKGSEIDHLIWSDAEINWTECELLLGEHLAIITQTVSNDTLNDAY